MNSGNLSEKATAAEKTKQIFDKLKWEYKGYNIADSDLHSFAEELYEHVFVDKGSLVEVMAMVSFFEEEMFYDGETEEYDGETDETEFFNFSKEWYVFTDMIDLLDINEENAQRLYNTFLEFRDSNIFALLMTFYAEWITEEQREKILSIARGEFDKTIWEEYI